jgi:hypothetical protein
VLYGIFFVPGGVLASAQKRLLGFIQVFCAQTAWFRVRVGGAFLSEFGSFLHFFIRQINILVIAKTALHIPIRSFIDFYFLYISSPAKTTTTLALVPTRLPSEFVDKSRISCLALLEMPTVIINRRTSKQ